MLRLSLIKIDCFLSYVSGNGVSYFLGDQRVGFLVSSFISKYMYSMLDIIFMEIWGARIQGIKCK